MSCVCNIYIGLYSGTYVLVLVLVCLRAIYSRLGLYSGAWHADKNVQCTLWPRCSSFVWSQVHGVQKNQIFQRLMSTLFLQRAGGNFILILVQSLFVTACMSHCIFPTVHCLKYAFPTGVNISQRKWYLVQESIFLIDIKRKILEGWCHEGTISALCKSRQTLLAPSQNPQGFPFPNVSI